MRAKNPFADPVQIARRRGRLIIRYYPTGLVTDPNDRVKLPGSWDAADPASAAECERTAENLRRQLYAHRAAHGVLQHHPRNEGPAVTLADLVAAFLSATRPSCATGTTKAHATRLNTLLVAPHGMRTLEELPLLAHSVIRSIEEPADRVPRSASTRNGYRATLAAFGAWVERTHHVSDPFANRLSAPATRAERKAAARAAIENPDPFASWSQAVLPESIPTMEQVLALRDAITRRETSRPPGSSRTGRGSRGGPPALDPLAAAHVAEAVTFMAATGCRLAETLGVHVSRVDPSSGRIVVDRQLDRYRPWIGAAPPLAPPKHDRPRITLAWPSYLPVLARLCERAAAEHDGWLFPPTRAQRYWTKGFEDTVLRARELLEWEHAHDAAVPTYPFTIHSLRHFYASHSLTPALDGGLGWSIAFVQRCLGHADQRTTQGTYRHVTDLEYLSAITSPHTWPGLDPRG